MGDRGKDAAARHAGTPPKHHHRAIYSGTGGGVEESGIWTVSRAVDGSGQSAGARLTVFPLREFTEGEGEGHCGDRVRGMAGGEHWAGLGINRIRPVWRATEGRHLCPLPRQDRSNALTARPSVPPPFARTYRLDHPKMTCSLCVRVYYYT